MQPIKKKKVSQCAMVQRKYTQNHTSKELSTLIDNLLDVPTALHVDYYTAGDKQLYLATWKENGRNYKVYLGEDIDGRIAKRITRQERRERKHQERLEKQRASLEAWIPLTCTFHETLTLSCA